MMAEEEEEERVMMSRRMESGAGIDLSLPITSTYLRRMRGLSTEPKVNNFFLPPLFYVLLMQWV